MILDICPIPKGRPRFSKFGHAYTPERTRTYEDEVKWRLKEVFKNPTDKPVNIICRFIYKRDADLDNMVKALTDSGNGVIYTDDRQIVGIQATKRKARSDEKPCISLDVFEED